MSYMEQQMQQHMEAGEHEHDELCERLNPPNDWQQPDWAYIENGSWRNYVSEDTKAMWLDMSGRNRLILAANFNEIATDLY